jgi:activator of HSP90 ATPase
MKPFGVILQGIERTNNNRRAHMFVKAILTPAAHARTRRQVITGGAIAVAGVVMRPLPVLADASDEVSHTAEAIHQERLFKASRKRIYEALTITEQFDRVTQLTGVMQSAAMSKMQKPTAISPHVGGRFALFGGYIVGRHIELVPNELIVQAWRVGSWDRWIYSIVSFQLAEQGAGTKIIFDHAGFPKGQAEHLASGWQEHYWDPLGKFLS